MADETQNMNLKVPRIGINGDTQDVAAQKINDNFNTIDGHDHSLGKGVPIRTDGINIDKNLSFNQKAILNALFLNFKTLTTVQEENDLPAPTLYMKDNILKLKNTDGTFLSLFDEGHTVTPISIANVSFDEITNASGDQEYRFVFILSDGAQVVSNAFPLDFAIVLDGVGVPNNLAGVDGNLYVDIENDLLYYKISGAWKPIGGAGGGGGLSTVESDTTLTGDGSAETPLGVAVPYSTAEKNKLANLSADDLLVSAKTPVIYSPSVIFHDPSRSAGNHGVALSEVIAQIEANNPLYTQRQSGSFVSAENFNPLTVETVTYGTISAKALVVTYNGNLFNEQQLIKLEFIDSTGELTKEYLFPPSTIQNGFDYVISDALANSSIHKKEVRVRITYDSTTNKTKIFIHQRPVSDPPPALYLFIIALTNVEALSQKGEDGKPGQDGAPGRDGRDGRDGVGGGLALGRAFPASPAADDEFALLEDITGYKKGIYYYDSTTSDWEIIAVGDGSVGVPADGSITRQKLSQAVLDIINSKEFTGFFNRTKVYKQGEIFDIQGTFIQVTSATWQASVDSPTFGDNVWRTLITNSAHRTSVRALTLNGAVFNVTKSGDKLLIDYEDGRTDAEIDIRANLNTSTGSLAGSKITDNTIPESKLDLAARTKLNNAGTLADGSVTTTKLAPFAVTGPKIAGGAVDETKLITAVRTKLNNPEQQILDDEFAGSKITNNTISESKLDAAARTKLNSTGSGGTSTPVSHKDVFVNRSAASNNAGDAWLFIGSSTVEVEVGINQPTPPTPAAGAIRTVNIAITHTDWDKMDRVQFSVAGLHNRLAYSVPDFLKAEFENALFIKGMDGIGTGNYRGFDITLHRNQNQLAETSSTTHRLQITAFATSNQFGLGRVRLITDSKGQKGLDGVDGRPGRDGTDGNDGRPGRDGTDGNDGRPGADGADASTLFADATDKLTNNNITDNTISGNKLQNSSVSGSKIGSGAITNSKVGVGIAGSKIANIPESSLDTAARTKLNAPAALGTATGLLSGSKISNNTITSTQLGSNSVINSKILNNAVDSNKISNNAVITSKILDSNVTEAKLDAAVKTKLNASPTIPDNSITGTKLANLTIPSSKLGSNSVTNSKVSNGIAGSKISNIPESSLSSGVQTKLNASGGGGGASVSTDAQFATGSDTLAPSVNQSKSYADSKDAFLVLWEGQFGNASADNVTTIGNKATISGLNEYDATNDRQTITKGGGAGNNTLIEWENPNIDARRATFLSELTMNDANWTMSAQIGYTSLVAGDNALEIQQGGWGFLCTRSPAIIGSNAGIFGLSLFVGQGGSLGATVSPREIASSQRELRGGALAPNGNNPYVRLPYDTQADKVVLHVERIGRLFRVYTDGILRMIVSLNDAQAAVPGNSGKFGYAGNPANTTNIRYYLLKAAVGNTVIRPLSGAGGGSSTVADNSVSTAKIQNLAVTGPKIASNAVITTKIANGAVTGPKIDANAVDTTKIFNGSVTEAKLSAAVQTKLNASGGVDFAGLGDAPELKDNDELVLNSAPGSDPILLTAGSVRLSVATLYGWDPSQSPPMGSININKPTNLRSIYWNSFSNAPTLYVYSDVTVDELVVDGVSFALSSNGGTEYRLRTSTNPFPISGQIYRVKVLNNGVEVFAGAENSNPVTRKITLLQLKAFLGIS